MSTAFSASVVLSTTLHISYQESLKWQPLGKLTVKGEAWEWRDEHAKAFQKAKNLVAKTPVLAYYDLQKPLVQYDASERGLGAALLQDDQPVVLASRALAPTEVW